MNRLEKLNIKLPIFLPDATRAITKSLDSVDMDHAHIKGAVVNTFHLMQTPGIANLRVLGGVKSLMNYHGLIVSDSGGWQVFSLIKRHNLPGKITDDGVLFKVSNTSKELFTPEKSIEVQFAIGSDIIICLDDFVGQNSTLKQTKDVVDRTIHWAKRCKNKYEEIVEKKGLKDEERPLLFSVIQGGYVKEERKRCAEELIKIGFDGYGYGGYVIDKDTGKLNLDISEYLVNLIPKESYKFALGFGKPEDIKNLYEMGWQIFDCTLPTRDARHKRLYIAKNEDPFNYEYLYINKAENKLDNDSIDKYCDCHTCKNFSRAYIHHLFKIEDFSAYRLATIHNLRFYTRLMEHLQNSDNNS